MTISEVKFKNGSGEEVYALREPGTVNFGRDKKVCHITFDPKAARVSRVHASLEWGDEGVVFTDKSKEGTTINGKRVKQSQENFKDGLYQLDIGGVHMSIEIVEAKLDDTVVDSPTSSPFKVPEPVVADPPVSKVPRNTRRIAPVELVEELRDNFNDISTISSFTLPNYKNTLKRKSDASLFEESRPRGKKDSLRAIDFDEEMENCVRKGSRARKAFDSVLFEEENPAKKMKTIEEKTELLTSKGLMKSYFRPKNQDDVEMESIVNQVAAIPSASYVEKRNERSLHDQTEMDRIDRGPSAHNDTIKYTNLIFRQPDYMANNSTRIDPNVPNFKRFVPKGMRGDGRTSAASVYSHNNTTFNTTIPMIDSRRMQ